jgi:exodeoxyribonuclease-3
MKLYSWNINGIRAAEKKGFLDWLDETQPEIVAFRKQKREWIN